MKIILLTNIKIKKEWLDELKSLVSWDIEVRETKEKLPAKFNPYFNQMWGDFSWIRSQITDGDIKVFVTSKADLVKAGITTHIGMYDKADGDTKHDIYIGIPPKKDKRATRNGFEYNFTWLVIHEYLHGRKGLDNTHEADEAGTLKILLAEDNKRYNLLLTAKNLLETIVGLLRTKKGNTANKGLLPRVERGVEAIISEMKKKGHAVRLVQGFRSYQEQDKLYAQGRTTPGAIVTNAKGGESYHNYGVGADFVFIKEGYNASSQLWATLGEVGKRQGFEWGGEWESFVDKPHFQMTLGYKLKDFQQGKVDYSKFN